MADAAAEPDPELSKVATPDGTKTTSADYYFNSYAHFGIHEEMLKDSVRTETYMKSIMDNAHLFKDKVVLDVGCGTGILCMFAAKAGAKRVIGVDCSDILDDARKIVAQNVAERGVPDVIELVKGKLEETELPVKEGEVDIIVSEWMGYFLFYESMLDSVLYARDKYLAKDGIVMPDRATLYMAGIEDGEYKAEKLDWWDNVYGFKMDAIKELAYLEPLVDIVEPRQIITEPVLIKEIDVMTCTVADLAWKVDFELTATCDDYCHAMVSYFDCYFSKCHKTLVLPTSPQCTPTHWKQTVFYMKDVLLMKEGEKLAVSMDIKPNEANHRDLDVDVEYKFEGELTQAGRKQEYKLR